MNLDSVFEDLEAQFAAQDQSSAEPSRQTQRFAWLESNLVLVQLGAEGTHQHRLIAPMIGADFVAGLLPTQNQWLMIPTCSITRLTFETQANLPAVRLLEVGATDFLNQLQICSDVFWRRAHDLTESAGWLLDARDGLLMLAEAGCDQPFGVPLARLSTLRFSTVENS